MAKAEAKQLVVAKKVTEVAYESGKIKLLVAPDDITLLDSFDDTHTLTDSEIPHIIAVLQAWLEDNPQD